MSRKLFPNFSDEDLDLVSRPDHLHDATCTLESRLDDKVTFWLSFRPKATILAHHKHNCNIVYASLIGACTSAHLPAKLPWFIRNTLIFSMKPYPLSYNSQCGSHQTLCHKSCNSQCHEIRSAHTQRIETVTWTHNTSPTCDLCNAHDVQDEQRVLSNCTHPHVVSLRRTYASLFPSAGFNVSAFLGQENNKLYFFLHALIVF